MITFKRTTGSNLDFATLIKQLNAYLRITDGDEHAFYDQYNQVDHIQHVIVAYSGNQAIACGAMKYFDARTMEIKRMFTDANHRQKGIAKQVLSELEKWALELDCNSCILETGIRQIEAVAFYKNVDYQIIPNFEPYEKVLNSICFKKELI